MRVQLYFVRSDQAEQFGREHAEPLSERRDWYDHVATLEVEPSETPDETLDRAWTLAQSGASAWTETAEVRWVSGTDLRSVAIGDVVVLEGSEASAAYEVGFEGWRRIDLPAASMSAKHPLSL